MNTGTNRLLGIAAVCLLLVGYGLAQRGRGMGMPNYDTKTEATTSGTVQEVQQHEMMGHMGTHLMLSTASGDIEVHVGPSEYIAQQQFLFAKGDQVEVTGSKGTIGGKEAVLAREIKKDGKVLTLRNEKGLPKWSRAGMRK
jgi:hypothetical protein